MNKKFSGLMAAPFTPFTRNHEPALDIIPKYVDKLIADGVKGIFVCGSTGEGPNMTSEQRMATAAAFKDAAGENLKTFIHVGHSSIAEAQKLAEHAAEIGADAISSVAAFYFKPDSEENLVSCLSEIAKAAPSLPFYYYHIPHLTKIQLDMMSVLGIAEERIPNLRGLKYTATTLYEYQRCLDYGNSKYDVLYGFDEMILSALVVGAGGMVGSTYNFAAPIYISLINDFHSGNIAAAREKMLYLTKVIAVILKFPAVSAQKAIMKRFDLDLGPSLQPLATLDSRQEASLYRELDDLQFFEVLAGTMSTIL